MLVSKVSIKESWSQFWGIAKDWKSPPQTTIGAMAKDVWKWFLNNKAASVIVFGVAAPEVTGVYLSLIDLSDALISWLASNAEVNYATAEVLRASVD